MPRYQLTIEYVGTPFHGWQRQHVLPTVQTVLEAAAQRFAGTYVEVVCAGRTDAGVHATAQVAHIDLSRDWEPFRVAEALNFHCKPHPVSIIACRRAPPGFHARFSAIRRAYRYRIINRRAPLTLDAGRAWGLRWPLVIEPMQQAALHLLGRHDFSSFRAVNCQAKSPLRTLDRLDIHQEGEVITIETEARSFLYHQVRNMVGTLVPIGLGRRPPDWAAEVLAARNRAVAGETAPPDGLYLTAVGYPDDAAIAAQNDSRGQNAVQHVGIDNLQGPAVDQPGEDEE